MTGLFLKAWNTNFAVLTVNLTPMDFAVFPYMKSFLPVVRIDDLSDLLHGGCEGFLFSDRNWSVWKFKYLMTALDDTKKVYR